ncbi:MAG: hypothetical protein NT062_27070 [Proteobacteria bacterium]|nr:hypothetical protein [Pseudomonadota bacterium]
MRSSLVAIAWLATALAPGLAHAEVDADEPARAAKPDEQFVLLNATNRFSFGQVDRLRRVFDQRGLLRRLPATLEAALDGRSISVNDIDAIKEAYGETDFAGALALIDADEQRILKAVGSGDPIPALAELSQWRGLIFAAQHQDDLAVDWFRAASRFNPAWSLDKKYASPSMLALTKRARREVTATGKLRIEADPEDAVVRVDGHAVEADTQLEVLAGYHYVVVTGKDRAPWADLVEVIPGKAVRQAINLDRASPHDKAATLIDATVTATPGKARLIEGKRLLGTIDGGARMLVIENGTENRVTLRLYDIDARKVSKPILLDNDMTSGAITRLVNEALDPDNMNASAVVVIDRAQPKPAIYERWYFWVGIAAVAVGGFAGYEYASREPTAVRF